MVDERSRVVDATETNVSVTDSIGVVEANSVKTEADGGVAMVVPFGYPVTFDGRYKHIDLQYYLVTEVKT